MTINSDIQEIISFLENLKRNGGKIVSNPLGFYRIFLTAKDVFSSGLLLHIWTKPNQHRKSEEIDIHCHIFDLRSRVLCGCLTNRLYEIKDSNIGNYKIVNIEHDGIKPIRVITDRIVEPSIILEEKIESGQIYNFKSKIYHTTDIEEYPTITLLEKTNLLNEHPVNLIRINYEDFEIGTYQQPDFDQEEVWRLIFQKLSEQIK